MAVTTQHAATIQTSLDRSYDRLGDSVDVRLSISATTEEHEALHDSIVTDPVVPGLSLNTKSGKSVDDSSKERFRAALLEELRNGWSNAGTESHFLTLVTRLQRDGCTILAGLIDPESFQHLIDDYTAIMNQDGSHAFLHSFAHLDRHPEFMGNPAFNGAIIHPLMIAMVAYAMGGPVRMTDARGKDTQPISVNAQDNMLHVDNTPFRQEYKMLIAWEQGQVKGPSGQNFTFLPGTNSGTRHIRHDEQAQPWSTENDSLFITKESIQSVFSFQQSVTGDGPTVVEVAYPKQPIAALFSASSLVHHRYRNKGGKTRSCIIMAFHLASDHPGSLLPAGETKHPGSTPELLMNYLDGTREREYCSVMGNDAHTIETKIWELLDQQHHSTMLDFTTLALSGQDLDRWREITIKAPSATELKFEQGHFISCNDDFTDRDILIQRLAAAMAYDKHGLLDLILYEDGHEETRKPARKSVWTTPKDQLEAVVAQWLPAIEKYQFAVGDVATPDVVRHKADAFAALLRSHLPPGDSISDSSAQNLSVSAHQLIVDLGESITRCEKVETYVTTVLFLFLTCASAVQSFDTAAGKSGVEISVFFLRTYIAAVLITEGLRGV